MKKTNLVLPIFALVFVLALSVATSAVAWVTPVNQANLTGSVAVSVTYVNVTDVTNPSSANSTFYWNGVAVSKSGFICASATCNATLALTGLTDAIDGALNVSLGNNSNIVAPMTKQIVTIDNTAPVCSVTLAYPSISYQGVQMITWSVTDALQLVTSTQTITAPSASGNLAYTVAGGSSTTIQGPQTAYSGNWNASDYGVDRAGNTCSASKAFSSYVPGNTQNQNTAGTGTSGTPNYKAIAVIGGLALIGYLLVKKK